MFHEYQHTDWEITFATLLKILKTMILLIGTSATSCAAESLPRNCFGGRVPVTKLRRDQSFTSKDDQRLDPPILSVFTLEFFLIILACFFLWFEEHFIIYEECPNLNGTIKISISSSLPSFCLML